jgi:DNA-directed RNA polymerase specialized sigma24 family protein
VSDQEAFESLLAWLSTDRDEAGEKYEEIRGKLIRLYLRRGCTLAVAAELTDEVMNRVSCKLSEIAANYVGDPALYCYTIAQYVHLEHVKIKPEPKGLPPPDLTDDKERHQRCLDICMQGLYRNDRHLILEYYRGDKKAKIVCRKALADQQGLSLNTLRMRILRLKTNLRLCVGECVAQRQVI